MAGLVCRKANVSNREMHKNILFAIVNMFVTVPRGQPPASNEML